MTDFVYQDQLNPDSYVLTVTSDADGLDLTTIASASFRVRREADNSESTWTATLSGATATALTLTYLFVSGDIDTVRGPYDIYAHMVITGSGLPQRTVTQRFVVKGKYEV